MSPDHFINRELSWIEFNNRVLDEATNEANPTLERLKFLAITASNLDEFFMVRVGGLQMQSRDRGISTDPAGMTADQQLAAISERVHRMVADQYACLQSIDNACKEAGIRRAVSQDLNEKQVRFLSQLFDKEISAILSPQAVVGEADFPLLANQTLNLCVELKPHDGEDVPLFAVIPLGRSTQRFINVQSDHSYLYILLEEVVTMFIDRFFPGETVAACVPFRITRNADMAVREDMAADLLVGMEEVLDERKTGGCVRLEIGDSVSPKTLEFLMQTLDVTEQDVYRASGPLELSAFFRQTDIKGFDHLRFDSQRPQISPEFEHFTSVLDSVAQRDVLLCHPFESFEPVVRLVEEAADDPDVLAIKQTLYRTSRNSPIVAALMRAAEAGKYVTVLVELKARFDEARNIHWARELEQAGVQVIFGVKGLKTHAKICVIVRREPQGIRRYIHFGTGNYNEMTARLYTDISFFTTDETLGGDASAFFNAITGYSQPQRFDKLEMAPIGLREKLLELIAGEIQRKKDGSDAHIHAKVNSLADPTLIQALYEASQAGVEVKLNIRGICCLRPGVPGLSENIEVVSIVDRYLEHSRIVHFHHGGDDIVFFSSADWMPRNLDRRVELLVPVESSHCRKRLLKILQSCLHDNVKGRRLQSDGSYQAIKPKQGKVHHSQQFLYAEACEAVQRQEDSQRTVFVPYWASDGGAI
ncbi:polyphosphate kinase 1 [Thalassoroseus pseudoceratinae]|uniref:polyphosphate kinase 1 n=1 Tax=Thalassoroseus pseudoceratinae TaxID=2713176 RepID=UPI00141DC4CF|nr:polyphosphate kinase 1 [Thalassoroseus pseudoceratinae]